ncbi:similar to RING 1B [Actinidia rufa]|uniref:Similar to RING 1B n=1 Tax=Actinidia rufa TaxID=165716 RepID=A0A7J0GQ70_9ERIC|nr:similar to RING 1B [Actinidia rufa]
MGTCRTSSPSYICTMSDMSRECIDKSMRLGNNECPACRTHCASRRSLRDDPRFNTLIDILYEDLEKYEEELAFHEEEKTRNKQIQASIAQIVQRQSEALVTRRQKGKDAESSRLARAYTRRRRNTRGTEHEGSEDNADENNHDGNKDSSSTDERGTEIKQRRYKRRTVAQSSQPSPPSAANSEGGGIDNDLEASKERKGTPSGHVRTPEMLAWGGGGTRSKSVPTPA